MKTAYTFADVKKLLQKIDPKDPPLIQAFDVLTGVGFALLPFVAGPAGAVVSALAPVREALVKAGEYVFSKLTTARNDRETPLARAELLQLAFAATCHVSVCEAVSVTVVEVKKQLKLHSDAHLTRVTPKPGDPGDPVGPVDARVYSFPVATDGLAVVLNSLADGYRDAARQVAVVVKSTQEYETAPKDRQQGAEAAISALPRKGEEYFRANLVALAREFADFNVWLQFARDEAVQKQLAGATGGIEQLLTIVRESKATIDVGLCHLTELVRALPLELKNDAADKIIDALRRRYAARLDEPIVRETSSRAVAELTFPPIRELFIPQSFKAVARRKDTRLESDAMWNQVKSYDELGPFLLHTLESPHSFNLPLVILGHPGSGKSLLSEVLAGRLLGNKMFPIRVQLRDINADADIQDQIEQWVRKETGECCNWTDLSRRLADLGCPPLVILDGYDELLQASGRVFATYVVNVQRFLEREELLGRCARAVVTSRMTLIDKAVIPENTIVVRLDPFDAKKQVEWVRIWNAANYGYFAKYADKVKPFALPKGNAKVAELASQPLLLLMLALYDSEDNALSKSEALDQTALYDDLLRRFIRRERTKGDAGDEFNALESAEQVAEIDRDLERLGVAAVGMFNRRALHIASGDLNQDIKFFQMEEPAAAGPGKLLTAAEKLLGSFFFVHQSRGGETGAAQPAASFEFLHNTFGEYLTAEFLFRRVTNEVEDVNDDAAADKLGRKNRLGQRLDKATAFPPEWYACLAHTPLHTRPVVLRMFHEWSRHEAPRRGLTPGKLAHGLDVIVENQLERVLKNTTPPVLFTEERPTPFPRFPVIGHFAVYTLNLVLIRTALVDGVYRPNLDVVGAHEDGTTPWEQLTYLWRSWFSLANLGPLANLVSTELVSKNGTPKLTYRKDHARAGDPSREEVVKSVAEALGDPLARALSGACFGDRTRADAEATQRAVRTAALPLELTALVCTMEADGEVDKQTVSSAVELILKQPEREHPAQLRLLTLLLRHGLAQDLFRQIQPHVTQSWVLAAAPPIVVAYCLWGLSVGVGHARDAFLDLSHEALIVDLVRLTRIYERQLGINPAYRRALLSPLYRRLRERDDTSRLEYELERRRSARADRLAVLDVVSGMLEEQINTRQRDELESLFRRSLNSLMPDDMVDDPELVLSVVACARQLGNPGLASDVLEEAARRLGRSGVLDTDLIARLAEQADALEVRDVIRYLVEPVLGRVTLEYGVSLPAGLDSTVKVLEQAAEQGYSAEVRDYLHHTLRSDVFRTLPPAKAARFARLARRLGEPELAREIWGRSFALNPERLSDVPLSQAVGYFRLAFEAGDRGWIGVAWHRSEIASRHPRDLAHLDLEQMIDLLQVASLVGGEWAAEAVRAWRKSSPAFAALYSDDFLNIIRNT